MISCGAHVAHIYKSVWRQKDYWVLRIWECGHCWFNYAIYGRTILRWMFWEQFIPPSCYFQECCNEVKASFLCCVKISSCAPSFFYLTVEICQISEWTILRVLVYQVLKLSRYLLAWLSKGLVYFMWSVSLPKYLHLASLSMHLLNMLSMATSTISFQHLLLPTLSSRIRVKSGANVLNPFKGSNNVKAMP